MQESTSKFSRQMILLLAATSALGPVSMQIMLPALPVIKESFNVSTGVTQLTLSLSMMSIAVATLIYGPLSDRFGRKPVMIFGLWVTLIGCAMCVFAETIELLILGRIVQAAGAAVGLVVARAITRDVYGPTEAARVISTLVMVMVVMPMLSPAVGAELMVAFGWHSVFVFVAVISAVILLILIVKLPETLIEPVHFDGVSHMLTSFFSLFKSRAFCGYAFNVAFVSVVFFSFISAAPEIMASVLHRPATEYGYYFMFIPAGFMTGNFVSRHYGSSWGIHRMIHLGSRICLIGISLTIVLQWIGPSHPLTLFLPVAIATFGNGITLPNAQAGAINEFPKMAGTASGLTGFLQMALSAIAAQLVALIFNGTVYPMLFLMLGAALISLAAFHYGTAGTAAAKN